MNRLGLIVAAALFFAWENIAMVLWLRAHGGFGPGLMHAWRVVREDLLVLLVLTDACMFTLCALIWLWRDLRQHVASRGRRLAWFALTIVVGSPGLLVYLATRPSHQQGAPKHD